MRLKRFSLIVLSVFVIGCSSAQTKRMLKSNVQPKAKHGYIFGTYSRDYMQFLGDPTIWITLFQLSTKKEVSLQLKMPEKEKGTFLFELPVGDYILTEMSTTIETQGFRLRSNYKFSVAENTCFYLGFMQFKHSSFPAGFRNDHKYVPEIDKKILLKKYPAFKGVKFRTEDRTVSSSK